MELAVPGAVDHSPEVAAWRADGFPFGSDHRDGGCSLVASHRLAGVDPGGSTDAELLAKPVGSFDNVGPVGRKGEEVGLQLGGDSEDEVRCHGRKRLL